MRFTIKIIDFIVFYGGGLRPKQQKTVFIYVAIFQHCSATIQGAGMNGADVVLTGDTYLFKKEGKVWIEKNLTWSQGQTKETKELNLASRPHGYSINNYYNYVPILL